MTELDEAQRAAVASNAARILVLAGAGSGKTRTLTHRVARLVEAGAPPDSIVLATFTNQAARAMIQRLTARLGPRAAPIRAGTFHALAYRALRDHGRDLGWPPPRAVLTRGEQLELTAEAARAVWGPAAPSPRRLLGLLGLAVDTQRGLAEVAAERAPDLSPDRAAAAADAYAAAKARLEAVDFDDLLLFLLALLLDEGPAARALVGRTRHVLVDEYQDVTPLQAELTARLAAGGAHLCVVGDDAQSVYGWRGAAPDALARFADAAPTEIHALAESYRCAPAILAVANRARPAGPRPLELVTRRAPGPPVVVVEAPRATDQAAFVAQRIAERRAEGLAPERIAILYRAHRHALELELALSRWRIPYVVRAGARAFERPHVRDALAALRVRVDPRDALAWRRLLRRVPHVGPQRTEALLGPLAAARDAPRGLAAAARGAPGPARPGLTALCATLEHLTRAPAAAEAIRGLYEGPAPLFADDELDPEARSDLDRLAEWATGARDLPALLDAIALDDAGGAEPPRGAVTLSTVHQAKGLEWSAVFVVGLDEGAFPLRASDDDPAAAAEERRLFYVAVTRAADELYLTSSGGTPEAYAPPSRFLTGLPATRWTLT